jgi:hypothetical protein
MHKIPDFCALPSSRNCHAACAGEKTRQLFADSPARKPIAATSGKASEIDRECFRKAARSLFIGVDPVMPRQRKYDLKLILLTALRH